MFANLYKGSRSAIAFAASICFAWQMANSQVISYAPREKNLFGETKTFIAGEVSSNIVVWKYTPRMPRSQVVIYDGYMRVVTHKTENVFLSRDVYQFNFINTQSSFYAIAQICQKKKYYCQLAAFNENGDLLKPVKTLLSFKIPGPYYYEACQFVISENKKYMALIKNDITAIHAGFTFSYALFDIQQDAALIQNKTISIPYYNNGADVSATGLDNAGNLYFAQYAGEEKDSAADLKVYKCPANGSDCSTSVANLPGIRLTNITLKFDNYNNHCVVCALATKSAGSGDAQEGIFSSMLNQNSPNNDLSMQYSFTNLNSFRLAKGEEGTLSAKDIVTLTDGTCAIAVTSAPRFLQDIYVDNDEAYNYTNNYISNAYHARSVFHAQNPQMYQPGEVPADGEQLTQATNYNPKPTYALHTSANNSAKRNEVRQQPLMDNLILMRINNNTNKILWQQTVNCNHDINAFTYVNKYSLLNTGSSLNFICLKLLTSDKKSFETITVSPQGEVTIKPIMTHVPGYEIMVDQGVQVDKYSMVFPCLYGENGLAFAKLDIE